MLPIKIQNQKKFEKIGNELVDILHGYINEISISGYYTTKKKVDTPDGKRLQSTQIPVDPDTKRFFEQINNKSIIKRLIFIPPHDLKYIICWVNVKFMNDNVLKDISSLFVDIVYSKRLKKQELIDSIGLKTCPYCNRSYIYTIKDGRIDPQLDHFYPKAKYPLFAVSLYNLIPSCAICNSAGAKGDKDTLYDLKYRIISPYLIKHDDFQFNYKLLSPEIIKGEYNGESIEIFFDHSCNENDNMFHLSSLYKKHDDHIEDMLYKRKYVYTDEHLASLFNIIGHKVDKSITNRFIVGAYVEKENYHKRPLSKLYTEIAKRIGLIKK
jgi:5-methylcytosine-specific restriction endonuclease McrA